MKVFAFLLLFGFASASFHEMLDNAADEFVLSFLEGMSKAPSLTRHIDLDYEHADQVEDETKSELGKRLKETLNKILEKVKTAIEEGKTVEKEFIEKIRELREQLKGMREEVGDKAKALLEKIREKAREYLKTLLEKLGKNKRAVDDQIEEAMNALNFRDILIQLRDHIKKTVDPELLKEKIEKIFGQGSELLNHFLESLEEKGRDKMLILIDAFLDGDDEDDSRDRRGIKDYWEKVKNYFKDLKIDLQEKYMKFGEWVKNTVDKGMIHSKDKLENIKAIAKEFAKHAKIISKEVANEAGEFFRNYKDELGIVWDEIKEKLQEIKNRKD